MNIETLTPEEQAYFDSRGEPPKPQEQAVEPVQKDGVVAEAEATVEPAEPEATDEPQRQEFVSQKALHKERERRKAAEAAARERELELVKLQERLKLLETPPKAAEPKQEMAPPDPDEDVFAAVKHDRNELAALKERIQQVDAQQQQARQIEYIATSVKAAEAEFEKSTPDYNDAVTHLRDGRMRELMLWGATEQQAMQTVQQEALQIAAQALRMRKSPAEMAYELARQRGYRPKAAAPVADEAKIERAKEASKSLSGTGSSPTGPMTVERLLRMSDREFAAYTEKNPDTVDRLMGRG